MRISNAIITNRKIAQNDKKSVNSNNGFIRSVRPLTQAKTLWIISGSLRVFMSLNTRLNIFFGEEGEFGEKLLNSWMLSLLVSLMSSRASGNVVSCWTTCQKVNHKMIGSNNMLAFMADHSDK